MKKWFFKTFLADSLVRKAYNLIDTYLSQRYPEGWKRIQFAMSGWVTKLGFYITFSAALGLWIMDYLREGGQPEAALKAGYYFGVLVVCLGLARKIAKWFVYEEAVDNDGWLDDAEAEKPEGFDENEKAVVSGKLDRVKVDLDSAKMGLDKAQSVIDKATLGRRTKK